MNRQPIPSELSFPDLEVYSFGMVLFELLTGVPPAVCRPGGRSGEFDYLVTRLRLGLGLELAYGAEMLLILNSSTRCARDRIVP